MPQQRGADGTVGEAITRTKRPKDEPQGEDGRGRRVPVPTLERLSTYLRCLINLSASGIDTVSSAEMERLSGIKSAQFRKDLSYFYENFGEFGKPGVGYNVAELEDRVARILQIHRVQPILLIGAGNLGSALVGYPGLEEHKFKIVAAFDSDPRKVGTKLSGGLEVQEFNRLGEVNEMFGARMAIIAVPAAAAQAVADAVIQNGVRALLNFAPVILRVPPQVIVRNVSFLQELAVLSYHLTEGGLKGDK
jgi:redox-sensing transcriptional repressor